MKAHCIRVFNINVIKMAIKVTRFFRLSVSVISKCGPLHLPIIPIPAFILRIAVEGIIGHQPLLQKLRGLGFTVTASST